MEVNFRTFELPEQFALTQADRAALLERRSQIDKSLDIRSTYKDRMASLYQMILAFRPDLGVGDVEMWALNYIEALEGCPKWAIDQGRQLVMRGQDGREKVGFMPTPPEFARTVQKIIDPRLKERRTIHRLLAAKTYHEPTLEERERVARRLKALVSGMAARAEEEDRAEKEAEFRKREAIEEAARQAAASAAARQSDISPSSPQAERSSFPETHSASE